MSTTTTWLASGLATGLLLAASAPAYATSGSSTDDDLHLSFDRLDDAGLPLLASLGDPDVVGTVSAVSGAEVAAGPGRSAWGHSLRMERFRPDQPASPAVVVVRPAEGAPDRTDPGDEDFAFGADFLLDASSGSSATDNGDNLVQRGLFGPGPQYKIQVDGGYPSCRVSGSDGAATVRATERVQPEHWYRVRCRRVGDHVHLRVVSDLDSSRWVDEYVGTGPTGTLAYGPDGAPFSIGGKVDTNGDVLVDDSDQFNGLIDDVVFRHLD